MSPATITEPSHASTAPPGAFGSKPLRFTGPGTTTATIIAAGLATLMSPINGPPISSPVLMFGAAFVYVLLATVGMTLAERHRRQLLPGLLLAQIVPVAIVIDASDCRAALIAMPLVSMSVLFLSTRAALMVVGALSVFFAAEAARVLGEPVRVAQALAGFTSAEAFVVAFSRIALRERQARSEVERLVHELQGANARLADYVEQVAELATTKERNRIAREVHDSLGHYLTVASVQLEAARTSFGHDAERSLARMERVQHLLRDGLGELRRSVSTLRTGPASPKGFAQAMADLISECEAAGLPIEFSSEGDVRTLPSGTGFALYRAAQEALTNVRRHAKARRATVTLAYDRDQVTLTVADDGVGAEALSQGHGLRGLHERVALVHGEVHIDTRPGRGLALTVRVPG